jgi:LysM repeat protein
MVLKVCAAIAFLIATILSTPSHHRGVKQRCNRHTPCKKSVLNCVLQLVWPLVFYERQGGLYSPHGFLLNCAAMPRFHVLPLCRIAASAALSILIFSTQFSCAQATVTVQPGDTLWALAKRYTTTTQDILQVNGLTGSDLIPGAVLKLPSNAAVYVVQAGDTLTSVATRYQTTAEEILQVNGLTGSDLMPGAVLKLPVTARYIPQTYTVQAGDTLYDVAVAFSMTTDELIAINNLDGTTIKPGQILNLQTSATQAPPAPLTVTVQAGDTLWALANSNETTIDALVQANNLSSTSTLRPGDTLIIPGRYAPTIMADQGGTVPETVTVAKGDTLWDIASRYNTSVTALMAANNMPDTSIKVGQMLKIIPSNELLRASADTLQPSPAPSNTAMLWPVHGQITSYFGYRRLRIGGTNMHYGLDIDGETGDPIAAAVGGTVTYSGWRNGFGNLVIITNGNTEYYYAHASELFVNEGEVVAVGQHIANVGATGRVTGSHLHFEVRVDGTPVDPLPLLQQYAGNP